MTRGHNASTRPAIRPLLAQRVRLVGAALGVPSYRRYSVVQLISVTGTWMQLLAQTWFVVERNGSGLDLGLLTCIQYLPLLFLGLRAGVLADQFDRRKIMIMTQAVSAVTSLLAGLASLTGRLDLVTLYVLAGVLGLATAIENPARQTLVVDMVGMSRARSALGLSGMSLSCGRFIGPALGGLLITSSRQGLGLCFIANSVSFVLAIIMLLSIPTKKPERPLGGLEPSSDTGTVRAGFRVVLESDVLKKMVLCMLLVGVLSFNIQVYTPLLVAHGFHRGLQHLSILTSVVGLGSLVGALLVAGGMRSSRSAAIGSIGLGVCLCLSGVLRVWPIAVVAFAGVGLFSALFLASANVVLQEEAPEGYRGRVTAFYAFATSGTNPIGAPLMGYVTGSISLLGGFLIAGSAALIGGAGLLRRPAIEVHHKA